MINSWKKERKKVEAYACVREYTWLDARFETGVEYFQVTSEIGVRAYIKP